MLMMKEADPRKGGFDGGVLRGRPPSNLDIVYLVRVGL